MQHSLQRMLMVLVFCWAGLAYGQGSVKGLMQDAGNKGLLAGVLIEIQSTDFYAQTNSSGAFEITVIPYGQYTIQFTAEGYATETRDININDGVLDLGVILLRPGLENENPAAEDIIPTIMLSDGDIEGGTSGLQSISGVLNASRDVFSSKVAFAWSIARFRVRGYDSKNTTVFMNNIPMNDLESGRPTWWSWSGLNDVMRNRTSSLGLAATNYTFGDIGGASFIDSRASKQRKNLQLTYSFANRSYNHRVMLTYNTGLMANGWAFSASGSWRYAPTGAFVQGTYFNAASYFLSVEKKIKNHSIAFTAMGAPSVRGKAGPAVQELYDLAGTNFYNPYWGYQTSGVTGKRQIRNSRTTDSHQPLFILTHEAQLSEKVNWMTSVSYQFGKYGSSALDWYEAGDPRPEYYRYLPSFIDDRTQSDLVTNNYVADPSRLQVNWDKMYEINRNSFEFFGDANGVVGDTMWGNRARYIVEERRYDSQRLNFNTTLNADVTEFLNIDGGLSYQYYKSKNFKVVEDLLGADYYVDINRFVAQDSGATGNTDVIQNDLLNPNRVLKEGDVFGYNYEAHIHKANAWAQLNFTFNKVDFFVSGQGTYNVFWRNGIYQTGLFPDNSLGKSEEKQFFNYAVKGGLTYKFNGRNYLYANASYRTKAPFFRNAYVAARTRDQVLDGLQNSRNYSIEGGYILNAPRVKAKVTAFYTRFMDEFFQRSFYLDQVSFQNAGGAFVNYVMTGVNKQHFGIEAAGEVSLDSRVSLSAALSVGEYTYISRPQAKFYLDNSPTVEQGARTVYIKDFYIPNTPQMAFNVGMWYRAPKYWSFSFNFNYFHSIWADFFPDRRTEEAVAYTGAQQFQEEFIQPGSDLWRAIVYQEQMPGNFSADIFIRKSWKIKDLYIILGFGMSNILNNTNMRTSGFEQFRFDYRTKEVNRFPTRYYYAYGTNYMLSLTFRI